MNAENMQLEETPDPIDETSMGWKIFLAFVNDQPFNASDEELVNYAGKELNLKLAELPPAIVENLPAIIVAYMNMWSGWLFKGDFQAGKFKKEHYFQRFQKFMLYKVNALSRPHFQNALLAKIIPEGPPTPESNPDFGFSPYAISISCPPYMLNTMVFSNIGDDVVMKQHLGCKWHDLTTMQLLNWPYVEVRFSTEDICFVRRQATEFVRYLNFQPHECNKSTDGVIEHVEALNKKSCFSYNFLEEYFKEYLKSLKVRAVAPEKMEEISTILSQFLEDVKFININKSIATNTSVRFRLSQIPFIRNKKLIKGTSKTEDEPRVGYCEIVTPKVELVLLHFKAKQNDTPNISFEYTEKIKRNDVYVDLYLPQIQYRCTFCKLVFDTRHSKKQMMDHLKNEHKMEQHVRCTHCKKQFDVMNLTACRWKHKCSPSTVNYPKTK